ncbi:MAG: glycosyltransferase [Clostridium sp.]|nr:glycosyltransferase [Clostridium sp.]
MEPLQHKKERISIVVPVYQAAGYIAQTLAMVQAQTYTDWELILVDDASGDGSVGVIEDYLRVHNDPRIRLIRQKENGGAARARNTGVDAATGRYLAYLDADDVWSADKLSRELAFLKEKQAGFVFTAYEFGDADANGTGKIVHVPEELRYRQALSRTVIFTSTVLFDLARIPKELVKMPEIKSEDTAAWWRILKAGHTAYGMDEVTTIYRRPAKSLSSNKWEAMRRIWALYRKQEGLSVFNSARYFCGWAVRATLRRI